MNPNLLKGKKVIGSEGYVLGEVDDFEVDLSSWQVNAFCISLGDEATSELGFKKPMLRKIKVCLPTHLIKTVGDVITLVEPIRNLEDVSKKEIQVNPNRIEGKKVVGARGFVVGEAEGFDVDFDTWQVTGLQVGLTNASAAKLGFKTPFLSKVVIVVPSKVVSLVGNFIALKESVKNLESLVECIKSCQKQVRD